MGTGSSYLDILFTALSGIDGSVMPIIWFVANSILTVTFLWGVYDAFIRGGDVRSLDHLAEVRGGRIDSPHVVDRISRSHSQLRLRQQLHLWHSGLGDVFNAWTNGLATAWTDNGDLSMLTLYEAEYQRSSPRSDS